VSPTQFGVNPARLPKITFEPEPAYADSADDIAQPFGKLLNLGASVELLNQTGTSVRVRYVVTNTDRATLTNLRIGLMLTAGETVVSSTPAASQSGLELSYSLGDLAGTTSGEVILELQRSGGNGQVDFGAKAFASYLGSGVSAKTIPVQVKIPNAAPELLSSTVDANSHDPFVIAQAGKLDNDPARIFAFVRDTIGFEAYKGSLRGARGTLFHGAGNSYDKSNLLVAMLRASGVPAQYVQGSLTPDKLKTLIKSMFPQQLNLIGYVSAGDETADPENDADLLSDLSKHTWVQFDAAGNGMTDADPSFATAQIGTAFGSPTGTTAEIDQFERHYVRLRLRAETSVPSLLGGSYQDTKSVLEQTFSTAELVGRPIHLQHFVSASSAPTIISYTSFTYTPYLLIDETDGDTRNNTLIKGTDFQEVLTNFPFGSQELTGVFLDVDVIPPPGGPVTTYTRTILDRFGYDIRQNGGTPAMMPATGPALNPFDVSTVYIAPGDVPESFEARRGGLLAKFQSDLAAIKPQIDELTAANPTSLSPEEQDFADKTRELQLQGMRDTMSFIAERFYSMSRTMNRANQGGSYSKIYPASPRVVIANQRVTMENGQGKIATNLDLLKDDARVVLSPGQSTNARFSAGLQRGISENIAETTALTIPGLPAPISTYTIIQAAQAQHISQVVLSSTNSALLETLPLSAQAKARISVALQANKLVLVPSAMVQIGEKMTVGWYEVDGATADTIGMLEDGSHGVGSVEWSAVIVGALEALWFGGYFFFLGFFGGFATVLLPGLFIVLIAAITKADKVWLQQTMNFTAGFIGLDGLNPASPGGYWEIITPAIGKLAAYFGIVQSHIAIAAGLGLMFGMALGCEAAFRILGYLLDHSDPILLPIKSYVDSLGDMSRASTEKNFAGGFNAGSVQGSTNAARSSFSGQIESTWNGPISVSASATSFSGVANSVTDSFGQGFGTGTVTIDGVTAVSLEADVSGSVHVLGDGTVAFYGASTGLLGASGNWKNFDANVLGGATIKLTTDHLFLNGTQLPSGSYSFTVDSLDMSGSGAGLATNFVNAASFSLDHAAVQLSSAVGSLTVGGLPIFGNSGLAFTGYTGTVDVASIADFDTLTFSGNAQHLAFMVPQASQTTDQNTPFTLAPAVFTDVAADFTLSARAPFGWSMVFQPDGSLTVTAAGGLQSGTYSIYVSAQSKSDPSLAVTQTVLVSIGATQAGVSLDIVSDPALKIPYHGAQLPTAFSATVKNLGPQADTFSLSLVSPPSGFDVQFSEPSIVIPPGATAQVGIYLFPSGGLPAPGTDSSFEVKATSASDNSIGATAMAAFIVPLIHAVGADFIPQRITTPPGVQASGVLKLSNLGNVDETTLTLTPVISNGLFASALTTPASIAVGGIFEQPIDLTPDIATPLNTSVGLQLSVEFGETGARQTLVSGVAVEVAIPGAGAAEDAALQAALNGDPTISKAFQDIGRSVTDLYLDPTNPVRQDTARANIDALIALLDGDEFTDIRNDLAAIRDEVAVGDVSQLDQLAAIIDAINALLAAGKKHSFKMYLLPDTAVAQPNVATDFTVFLQNTGSASTDFDISLGSLPAGVTATIENQSVTVAAGQTSQAPVVKITNSGSSLVPFGFTVTATATNADAAGISHSVEGAFKTRQEGIEIFGVTATPPFVNAGGVVAVNAKATGALNTPRTIKFYYQVEDSSTAVVFTSAKIDVDFNVLSITYPLALLNFDSTGFTNGQYKIRVKAEETNGTPLVGAESVTGLFIGTPIESQLTVTPNEVAPGSSAVTAKLHVKSAGGLGSGLTLIGQTNIPNFVDYNMTIKNGRLYYGTGTGGGVADISDPTAPHVVANFGGGVPIQGITLGGPTNDILVASSYRNFSGVNLATVVNTFSLANPDAPTLLSDPNIPGAGPLDLPYRQFFVQSYGHGNRAYVLESGFRYLLGSNDIFHIWGGVQMVDVSNPAAPSLLSTFYTDDIDDQVNPPIYIQDVTSGFAVSLVDVNDSTVYHLSTNATQDDPGLGQGVVRVFDLTNSAAPTLTKTLVIPGTGHILDGAVDGNKVMLLGSTGGVTDKPLNGFKFAGDLVLTELDITDPQNPVISRQTIYPAYKINFVTRIKRISAGKFFIGENFTRASDGLNMFGIADSNAPGDIGLTILPSFPGAGAYQFEIYQGNLFVASAQGALRVYSLANYTAANVTASLNIPKNTAVAVVGNSFNIAPSSITDHGTYSTLFWDADKFPSAYDPFDLNFTFLLQLTNMKQVEAREVVNASSVDFVYNSAAGDIELPPAYVSSGFTMAVTPDTKTIAPGEETNFFIRVDNILGTAKQTYNLQVVGINPDWVTLQPQVTVNPANSAFPELKIKTDSNAAEAEYHFTVIATPVGQGSEASAAATGTLILQGDAVKPNGIAHGVDVQLIPDLAVAGRGMPAHFRVRVTNTGQATDFFNLSFDVLGFDGTFSQDALEILPGASNAKEVGLDFVPQASTNSFFNNFKVFATTNFNDPITDSVDGTIILAGQGVKLELTPSPGSPNSQMFLKVTNTGMNTDTFDLSIAGPAAPFATLTETKVTLASGVSQNITILVGDLPNTSPGSVDLVGAAVSETNPQIQNAVRGQVNVQGTNGMDASFLPSTSNLPTPGDSLFFLSIANTGNLSDNYSVSVIDTTSDLTATMVGPDGNTVQNVPLFRLPGLARGGFLVRTNKPSFGDGTVTVRVSSNTQEEFMDLTALVHVGETVDLCPNDETKTDPGICGCGVPDIDRNDNGVIDCVEPQDLCPNDPQKTAPGVCGCGTADVDLNENGTIDCVEQQPSCSGICNTNLPNADDDGDGVSNCTELEDHTNPCDSGSFIPKLVPMSCAGANGYFQQINIATVLNKLSIPLGFNVQYRDSAGVVRGEVGFVLSPQLKRDIIINDLGLKSDTYGTVCVTVGTQAEGAWSGGVAVYKARTAAPQLKADEDFDFALYLPFENPQKGTATLTLNTNSIGTDGLGLVANWVRITDSKKNDGNGLRGTLRYYHQNGSLATDEAVNIPDGGRFDFPAHERLGTNAIGLAEFTPENANDEFYFEESRYFYEGVAANSTNFYTAFTIPRRPLTGAALTGRTPVRSNEVSVLEMINGSSNSAQASLKLFGEGGSTLGNEAFDIPAKGSFHRIVLSGVGSSGDVQTAQVSGPAESLGVTTLSYVFDKEGKLLYGYAQPFAESAGLVQFTEFNSFIGHKNVLDLSNSTDSSISLAIRVLNFDNTTLMNFNTDILPRANLSLDLAVPQSTYGTVIVDSGSQLGVLALGRVERPNQYVLSFPGK